MPGSPVRIRTALAADAAAVAAIYAPIVRDTSISFEIDAPDAEEMAARMRATLAQYPWLVAEDPSGAVVGFAYGHALKERAAYRWSVETSVYVAAGSRGQGHGAALYARLLELLTRQGFVRAHAGITLPNPESEAFHAAFGFARSGLQRDVGYKLGRWHDVARWERALRTPAPEPPAEPVPFPELDARFGV